MTDQPPYNPRDYGIQPAYDLAAHMAASRRRGRAFAVGLVILFAIYLLAIWQTGGQAGVIIAGGLLFLVAAGLAYRSWLAALQETDRLIDEMIAKRPEDQ